MNELKQVITESESAFWKSPTLNGCEDLIDELSDSLFLNKNKIINVFHSGKLITMSNNNLEKIKNFKLPKTQSFVDIVDYIQKKTKSNPEYQSDWLSIKKAIKNKSSIPAPVIMKHENSLYLLDGAVRIMIAKILKAPLKVFIFTYK